jgi:hypothetical protein
MVYRQEMSAHKIKYVHKVILDLTDKKVDYNKVLKKIKIIGSYTNDDDGFLTFVRSGIKIGKYIIFFNSLTPNRFAGREVSIKYLSINDNLRVDILEDCGTEYKNLKSSLIEAEPWFHNYLKCTFSMKDLKNVALFCNRLESLTSFS